MINNTEPKVINTIDRGIKKAISPSSNSISVPATKKLTKPLRKKTMPMIKCFNGSPPFYIS